MANYIKNNNRVKVPNPGIDINQTFDIGALANAVAAAISLKIPTDSSKKENLTIEGNKYIDTFDTSKTMNRLADQMLVERGKGKSNFEDLGSIKKTKKDQKDVDDTIDLLKNLDD